MSLSQQAYLLPKEKIITLQLPPGAVIDEVQICDELRPGWAPVCEALQRLARKRFVRIVLHRFEMRRAGHATGDCGEERRETGDWRLETGDQSVLDILTIVQSLVSGLPF